MMEDIKRKLRILKAEAEACRKNGTVGQIAYASGMEEVINELELILNEGSTKG